MKIAILSQAPRCYSTRRIREAAEGRGHEVHVFDTTRFSIMLQRGRPSLYFKGEELPRFDAVIPRIGASVTFFGTAVVRQFEHMGVFCLNCAESIVDARDKLRSMQLLNRHNIDIPASAMVRSSKDITSAIQNVGGAPVVLKLIQGTQGVGVILSETNEVAEATMQTLRSARQNVLIQKFVAESRGRDIRAFVVGDRVVAAMRRIAKDHEFRSNVHRGGRAESITLDAAQAAVALKAAHVVGLHVAGVDLLESRDGPKVAEVNCSPGLEGIETTRRIDVAEAIIEYLEAEVELPEGNRQWAMGNEGSTRHSELGTRYSEDVASREDFDLAEIIVTPETGLAGQTIGAHAIEGRGLTVLRLDHRGEVIVRPEQHTVLHLGDRLLCFGRARELQTLRGTTGVSESGVTRIQFPNRAWMEREPGDG